VSLSGARRAVGHGLHGHREALLAEADAARAGWLEQWPDGDRHLPGLLAQDVQAVVYARFDPLWPLCPTCGDHALFVEPDLGEDSFWCATAAACRSLRSAGCRWAAMAYVQAMGRLPLVDSDSDDADPLARQMLQAVSAARGRSVDPNVYRAVANHPQALQAMVQFGTVVYFQNTMSPAQRELAYLTASVTNECHY